MLISAVLYSIMPVLIRFLGTSGLPPMTQVFFRYSIAFGAAIIYFFLTSKTKIKMQKKHVPTLLIATIYGYALTNVFYTYAILNTQVGNALFLVFTFAIIAPVLGFFMLKAKLNTYNIIGLLMTLVALFCLFQPNAISTWRIGGMFALATAVGQALYVVLRKKLTLYPANLMMLLNTGVGVIIVGTLSFLMEQSFYFTDGIWEISLQGWIVTFLFGLVNFFAWLTMTKAFEYLSAATGSIVLLLELLIGLVFAFIFFGEIPTTLTILGGALIALASVIVIKKGHN